VVPQGGGFITPTDRIHLYTKPKYNIFSGILEGAFFRGIQSAF